MDRSKWPEYRVWERIQQKCGNPRHERYCDYGGRGIEVCPQWRGRGGFDRFLADMGKKPSAGHSIERINNDGNYEPGNCRWATDTEQRRNRRNTKWVTFGGRRRLLMEVCAGLGLDRNQVNVRLRLGWPLERALTEPIRPKRKNGSAREVSRETAINH